MTQEEILEGNKLIAEFMGGIYVRREDLFDSHIIEEIIYNNNHPILKNNIKTTEHLYHLRYHLSWDWLMPVVEKIELLGFFTRILDLGMGIEGDLIIERFGKTKLEGVYITIIEFIKWYNLCQDGN